MEGVETARDNRATDDCFCRAETQAEVAAAGSASQVGRTGPRTSLRANDFSDLTALLRNFFRSNLSNYLGSRAAGSAIAHPAAELKKAKTKRIFRTAKSEISHPPRKSLRSLGRTNESFRIAKRAISHCWS
jgi:hypothetical protein